MGSEMCIRDRPYTVEKDECNRPSTTLESLAALPPVCERLPHPPLVGPYLAPAHWQLNRPQVRLEQDPKATVTAGNASQLSDGASACVLMSETAAEKAGVTPLGAFKGFAVGGCSPEEMGIGPTVAVPRLLERHGLKVNDHAPCMPAARAALPMRPCRT